MNTQRVFDLISRLLEWDVMKCSNENVHLFQSIPSKDNTGSNLRRVSSKICFQLKPFCCGLDYIVEHHLLGTSCCLGRKCSLVLFSYENSNKIALPQLDPHLDI